MNFVRTFYRKQFYSTTPKTMKFLNQEEAINIDIELFNEYKFSVDQLMELAGLSCAHAIYQCFPPNQLRNQNILVACGPGNNGGDGLVAARHLALMNYTPTVYYPRETDKILYGNLIHQCKAMGISILKECPEAEYAEREYGLIVDALFGFSFKPPVRDNFLDIMNLLKNTNSPIASIDVPSGWNIETGPHPDDIKPQLLISLTAPKLCSRFFSGIHYLGGRFVPPALKEKYQLDLPEYKGLDCCVKI